VAGPLRTVVRSSIALTLCLVVAGGCGDGGSDREPGYRAELRSDFVEECTDTGTEEAACVCLYEALQSEVPFDRFEEADEQLRAGGPVPADVEALAVACAAEPDDPGSE
jgi:hypothetical protein